MRKIMLTITFFFCFTNSLLASEQANNYTLSLEEKEFINTLSEEESEDLKTTLAENKNDSTLLMLITASGNFNSTKNFLDFLKEHLAEEELTKYINEQDKTGNTALHYSNKLKFKETRKFIRLLKQNEADEDIKNQDGKSSESLIPGYTLRDFNLPKDSRNDRYEIHILKNIIFTYINIRRDGSDSGDFYHSQLTYKNKRRSVSYLFSGINKKDRLNSNELVFFFDGKILDAPANVLTATLNFLLEGQKHDAFDCNGFFHSVFGVEWIPHDIDKAKWNVQRIRNLSELETGSGIIIYDKTGETMKHFAICLDPEKNIFISKYYQHEGLFFSKLEEMQRLFASGSTVTEMITPKLP